ncbi:hypothetical protein [Nitrosomonas aestuarii]|uniref:hypothetical protein n=1 Tax=Nitrosomonas aestuarii TaxID=52441 RepID=UPI00147DFF22|nr:hypothetical protein [Nitrosomonas aestuarii]
MRNISHVAVLVSSFPKMQGGGNLETHSQDRSRFNPYISVACDFQRHNTPHTDGVFLESWHYPSNPCPPHINLGG